LNFGGLLMMFFIRNAVEKSRSATQTVIRRLAAAACGFLLLVGLHSPVAQAAQPLATIGARHQAEGAIQQGLGKAKENVSDLKGKVGGLSQQAQGKAKRDIGRIESAVESASTDAKTTTNQIGAKLQTTAENLADTVKDIVN
jgi:uncharacterized protein YjbJ (UPF0337 family)